MSDSDEEENQQERPDASHCYYQRYRYCPRQNHENGIQIAEPLVERQTKGELLFLKKKIMEKVKSMKRNSEACKELKSVLVDVDGLINNM